VQDFSNPFWVLPQTPCSRVDTETGIWIRLDSLTASTSDYHGWQIEGRYSRQNYEMDDVSSTATEGNYLRMGTIKIQA